MIDQLVLPENLEEAEQLLRDNTFEIQSIQDQLGNRDRRHSDGTRFSGEEYWTWRHKAAGALRHLLDEQRTIKAHVKGLRDAAYAALPPKQPLNRDMLYLLLRAHRDGDKATVLRMLDDLAARWLDATE